MSTNLDRIGNKDLLFVTVLSGKHGGIFFVLQIVMYGFCFAISLFSVV